MIARIAKLGKIDSHDASSRLSKPSRMIAPHVPALIFCLKLVATAVTFGAGGVGGLFVPTATIGAALGACWDAVLSPGHPGVFTLLGIAAFAGASYNSLLFAAVFIAESTGNVSLVVPALIASTLAFVVSAGVSNSRAQRLRREDVRLEEEGKPR